MNLTYLTRGLLYSSNLRPICLADVTRNFELHYLMAVAQNIFFNVRHSFSILPKWHKESCFEPDNIPALIYIDPVLNRRYNNSRDDDNINEKIS